MDRDMWIMTGVVVALGAACIGGVLWLDNRHDAAMEASYQRCIASSRDAVACEHMVRQSFNSGTVAVVPMPVVVGR